MALILVEGFDSYASGAGQDIGPNLVQVHFLSDVDHLFKSAAGRSGGYGMRILTSATTHYLHMTPPGRETHATWTVGFNFRNPSGGLATAGGFLRFAQCGQAGEADSVHLRVATNNVIEIRNGADSILASTANDAFVQGTWCHVEFQAFCHDSAGTVELKINGSTVASANGIDTSASSIALFNKLMISSPGNALYAPTIDDIYLCDGSGSTNNDFLGQQYVRTLRPTSDSTPSDGDPSTPGNHYEMIDEFPPDGSTSYVALTGNGDSEMYGFENLADNAGPVNGLQLMSIVASKSASIAKLKNTMKSGTSDVSSTAKEAVGGGYYRPHSQISETNPDTASAWTGAEVDGGTFGYELEI